MKTMNSILQSMESLDAKPSENSASPKKSVNVLAPDLLIHDEYIDNHTARIILGADYEEGCRYKMITELFQTVIVKIDDNYPADKEPVYDDDGRVVKGPEVEYVLEQVPNSYEPLHKEEAPKTDYNKYDLLYRSTKKRVPLWVWCLIAFVVICVAVWIYLMSYIF